MLPLLRNRPRPPRPWQGSERGGWDPLPLGPSFLQGFRAHRLFVQCGVGWLPPLAGLPRPDRPGCLGSPGLRGSGFGPLPRFCVFWVATHAGGHLAGGELAVGCFHLGLRPRPRQSDQGVPRRGRVDGTPVPLGGCQFRKGCGPGGKSKSASASPSGRLGCAIGLSGRGCIRFGGW